MMDNSRDAPHLKLCMFQGALMMNIGVEETMQEMQTLNRTLMGWVSGSGLQGRLVVFFMCVPQLVVL